MSQAREGHSIGMIRTQKLKTYYTALFVVMFLFIVLAIVFSSPQVPAWAPQYQVPYRVDFVKYSPPPYFQVSYNVMFYYDAVSKMSRMDFKDGQADAFCRSVVSESVECRQIVNGDWRYFYYPSTGKCCKCCNTTAGCGIVMPDWIIDNSQYVGTKMVGKEQCEGWLKKGNSLNYYYLEPAKPYGLPCLLVMNTTQSPFGSFCESFVYDQSKYVEGYIDPEVFDIPENCDQKCEGQMCSLF